ALIACRHEKSTTESMSPMISVSSFVEACFIRDLMRLNRHRVFIDALFSDVREMHVRFVTLSVPHCHDHPVPSTQAPTMTSCGVRSAKPCPAAVAWKCRGSSLD